MTDPKGENEVIAEQMHKLLGSTKHDIGAVDGQLVSVLEVASGRGLMSLKKFEDEYRLKPVRRSGAAHFADQASFIEHVNRFKAPSAAVFAVCEPPEPNATPSATVTAVLNYHASDDTSKNDHTATYGCPISEEWKTWIKNDGSPMKAVQFAKFLEDNILDIGEVSRQLKETTAIADKLGVQFAAANRLMQVARDLTIRSDASVTNAVNLQSGEATIHFEEKHLDQTGKPIQVPAAFIVEIPVLRDGKAYQLPARLRYRKDGTTILWWYDLHRTDKTWNYAIGKVLDEVKEATGLPVWKGRPEV